MGMRKIAYHLQCHDRQIHNYLRQDQSTRPVQRHALMLCQDTSTFETVDDFTETQEGIGKQDQEEHTSERLTISLKALVVEGNEYSPGFTKETVRRSREHVEEGTEDDRLDDAS